MARYSFPMKAFDVDIMLELRQECLAMGDLQLKMKAATLGRRYMERLGLKERGFFTYVGVVARVTDKAFSALVERKVALDALIPFPSLEPGVQDFLIDEHLAGNVKLSKDTVSRIVSYLGEGMAVSVAIQKAKGERVEVPKEVRRDFDKVILELARDGSKWRAKASMLYDALAELDGIAPVTLELFEKVYLLRHLVGEQYEFLNQKVKRFMDVLRRKAQARVVRAELTEGREEIEDAESARTATPEGGGEPEDLGEAGQALQDSAGEGEGA